MSSHAKASTAGSKSAWDKRDAFSGRLRVILLVAVAAALFLLAGTAQAIADTVTVQAAPGSTGEGTVTGGSPSDPLNCHIEGETASGECTTNQSAFFEELEFTASPEGGSTFVEWEWEGTPESPSCKEEPTNNPCSGGFFQGEGGTLKAKFSGVPPTPTVTVQAAPGSTGEGTVTGGSPSDPLNCHIEGETASGECTTNQSAFFEELEFTATGEGGSTFLEWEWEGTPESPSCKEEPTNNPCSGGFFQGEGGTLKAKFAKPVPSVTGLSPDEGPTAGGTVVTITGANFTGASKVAYGATEVTCLETVATCKVESATEIKATTPPHAAGAVDVRVTGPGGTSPVNAPADQFAFVAAPTVTAVSPTEGPTSGGDTVEITGTELGGASKVEFGTTAVNKPFIENTETTIKVKAPGHAAGTVDVTVRTVGGASATTPADEYTFIAPPAVTALSPAKGPTAGANIVRITGMRLSAASKVEFGTEEATILEGTATTIEVKAPAHAAGTVDVRVTTLGGTSGKFPQDQYTYVVPQSPPVPTTGSGSISVLPPPPPPVERCVVPRLAKKSLKQAKAALKEAHCALGEVSRPRKSKGALVVRSSKPGAGTTLAPDSAVDLSLGPKPKPRGRK